MKVLRRLNAVTAATDKEVEYFKLLGEDWKEFEATLVKPFTSLLTDKTGLVIKEYLAHPWIVDKIYYNRDFKKSDSIRIELEYSGNGSLYFNVNGDNEWEAGLLGIPFSVKSSDAKDYGKMISAYAEVLKVSEKDIKKAWGTASKDIKNLLKKKKLI